MQGNDKTDGTGKEKTIVHAIIAACVLGIIVIGALVLYSGSTSEGFSELYFENPEKIPRIVNVGEEIWFNFTLVSHEKTPVTYKYNVTYDDEKIEEGYIDLEPGMNKTLNITFIAHNTSLVPFDVFRLAVFNTKLNQNGEVQLPLNGGTEAFVTINLKDAKITDWNFTEVQRVGTLDDINSAELNTISSLGYFVRKDRYLIEDAGQQKTLNYSLNETEYRYEFKRVEVNVTSEKELISKAREDGNDDQTDRKEETGKAYGIHFWIIVKENPDKLLAL